jgi:hypothetical protein
MTTLILNKKLSDQSKEVMDILDGLLWTIRYEKVSFNAMFSDLARCINNELQNAIDNFEYENELPPLKFTSESAIRYIESLGITIDNG